VSAVDKQAARTPAGKWNKHVDAWDAIQDNEFFSPEAFAFVLKQLFQVAKPPDRFTPEYCIMKKFKDWEIRRRAPARPHFVPRARRRAARSGGPGAEQLGFAAAPKSAAPRACAPCALHAVRGCAGCECGHAPSAVRRARAQLQALRCGRGAGAAGGGGGAAAA